jgi:hypothetical protein
MLAGHLYLPDDQYDLTGKSGIYSIFEYYQNVNNIRVKNSPLSSIYEDFKTNNLYKYPYTYSSNIEVLNNENANCTVAGVPQNLIQDFAASNQIDYISFSIYPNQDGILNFYLYNPNNTNRFQLDYTLQNYYSLYINNSKIDLSSFYNTDDPNPQPFNYLFTQINYNLSKTTLYNIKIEFMSNLYYAIDNQDLTVTDIIFPYV